jgi:hypothetical protein
MDTSEPEFPPATKAFELLKKHWWKITEHVWPGIAAAGLVILLHVLHQPNSKQVTVLALTAVVVQLLMICYFFHSFVDSESLLPLPTKASLQ